jgi:hypothetical protein
MFGRRKVGTHPGSSNQHPARVRRFHGMRDDQGELIALSVGAPDDIQPPIPAASTLIWVKLMARARRSDCGAFAQKKLEQ